MNEKQKPLVKCPQNKISKRFGRGYSIGEIKDAGLNLDLIKRMNIKYDLRRKSVYKENVDLLKTATIKPKIKEVKPVEKVIKIQKEKVETKKTKVKEPVKKKQIEKKEKPKVQKEKKEGMTKSDSKAMTELSKIEGLTQSDAKKLINVGIMNQKDLLEMSEDLDILSEEVGIPKEKMEKWLKNIK